MSGLTVFLADRGIATLFQEMLHYIISPGGPSGAKKENKNKRKIVKHFSPSWPPFSFFMGPVDLSVWNPGQNTVFLVIVMVVLSQFLHKTRFFGHLDCFRDFELPPLFRGRWWGGGGGGWRWGLRRVRADSLLLSPNYYLLSSWLMISES